MPEQKLLAPLDPVLEGLNELLRSLARLNDNLESIRSEISDLWSPLDRIADNLE